MPAKKKVEELVEEMELVIEANEETIAETVAYLGNSAQQSISDTINDWQAQIRAATRAGNLSQMGPLLDFFAEPIGPAEWVVDRFDDYTVIATWRDGRWAFHAEINP